MAQNSASVQRRIFQRLAIPFDHAHQFHQDEIANIVLDDVETLPNKIIDGFHLIAVWYRTASSSALKSLVDSKNPPQEEVDRISARYETVLRKVHGYITRLVEMRQDVPPELLSLLVDGAAKFKEAWATIEQGHQLVDVLNNPARIQRLRDLTLDRKNRMIAFYEHRQETFQQSLQSAHEALTFWSTQNETLEARRGFVVELITKWEGQKHDIRARSNELQRELPESLHNDLNTDHPHMARGTRLKQDTSAIYAGLRIAATSTEETQAEVEVITDGEEVEGENEDEFEELMLVEEDGPESEEWSQEELDTLKGRLGNPFPVLIIAGEKKFQERSLYERQFLKENHEGKIQLNDCAICGDPLNDACLLSTCDHVFCIKCIARSLNAKEECPACRRSAQHDDLTPLEVTIVQEGGQMDVDG